MKMKISLNKLLTKKLLATSVGSLYFLNSYKSSNKAKCIPEEEDEFYLKEGQTILDESDIDLSQDEDLMKALEDPNISEEEKQMMKRQMKQQSIQPFSFSKLHAPFKTGIEEEKWNGLRGTLEWSPNQMNKMEYSLTIDRRNFLNNYKLSVMSIVPFNERSGSGAFLIGRKEGSESLGLQCHLNLSESSKILLVSSHPKPDLNQGHYVAEYTHEFERINATVKMSNMETSVSAVAALYKNLFMGFEAVKNPKSPQFIYNYGMCLKNSPQNKFGFALSYITAYPAVSFDFLYQITREWSTYLSYSQNWHPMAAMGGNPREIKLTTVYSKRNEFDFNFEIDYEGLMHFYHTHQINKSLALQANLEFNPFAHWNKKNKKVFRSFGVGVKFSTSSIEEEISNIQNEESFEEYEFDKISQDYIK